MNFTVKRPTVEVSPYTVSAHTISAHKVSAHQVSAHQVSAYFGGVLASLLTVALLASTPAHASGTTSLKKIHGIPLPTHIPASSIPSSATSSTASTATTPATPTTPAITTPTATTPASAAQPGTVAPQSSTSAIPPTARVPSATTPGSATATPSGPLGTTGPAGGTTIKSTVLGVAHGGHSSATHISTLALVLAVLGALLLLSALAWAFARWFALEPRWSTALMHSLREASYRGSATWAEFSDWVRIGR